MIRSRSLISLCMLVAAIAVRSDGRSADDPSPLTIEGYTDQLSYRAGEVVRFHISTTAGRYSMEIARLGAETQAVYHKSDLPGAAYPIPEEASSNGCNWPVAHSLTVPADWKSGYYNVRLRVADNGGKFVGRNRRTAEVDLFFIVRSAEPGKTTPILLQLSTNTYNAYTNWGGGSLYAYHGRANLQGHRVSFNRPLDSQFRQWELPFVAWAERNGYSLDYCANSDLEFHPELLAHYKLVLSVGHDEYWSTPMRDHLEAFIARGGNVAFFSGNTCCWQVRSEEGGRALTCWKQWFNQDPVFTTADHRLLTTAWSHYLVKRPENQLTGVGFIHGGYHLSHGQYMDGKGAFTAHRPEHWIYEGTGLKRGERVRRKAHGRRLRVRRLRVRAEGRVARRHRARRHARELRDPRHLPGALASGRCPLVRPVPARLDRRADPGRGRVRRLRQGRDGRHDRLHRLGPRPPRWRRGRRADHPERPGSALEMRP